MLILLVSIVRISASSTYLRYIEDFLMLLKFLFSNTDQKKLLKIGPRIDPIDTLSLCM